MAIFRSDTGVVEGGVETTFGTLSSNLARWFQLMSLPDRTGLKQVYHPADKLRTGNHMLPGVLGHKSESTIPAETFLRGYTDSAVTKHPVLGAALLNGSGDELMEIVALAQALGQIYVSGSNNTFATVLNIADDGAPADPTTTAFYIATGEGDNYEVGQDIAIDISTTGFEARRILTITDGGAAEDLITVEFPFSVAPARLKPVATGITIFPTEQPQIESLSMTVQGEDFDGVSYWKTRILGMCANAMGMAWDARGFIKANIDYDVADWERHAEASGPTYSADTGPERQPLMGAKFTFYTAGAPVCMDCSQMEFDAGLSMLRPLTPCGDTQGVKASRFGLHEPVFTVDPYKEVEGTWMDSLAPFRAATGVHFNFLGGDTLGSMVSFSVSNGHVTDDPVLGDRDGMLINPLQITPMVYTGDGTPALDERNNTTPKGAPWTITFF
jgi:hypothetical protein